MLKQEIEKKRNEIRQLRKEIDNKRECIDELYDQIDRLGEMISNQINELTELISEKDEEMQMNDYYESVSTFFKLAEDYIFLDIKPNSGYFGEEEYMVIDEGISNLKCGQYRDIDINDKFEIVFGKTHFVDYLILNKKYIVICSDRLNLKSETFLAESYSIAKLKKYGYICCSYLISESENMIIELSDGEKMYLYKKPIVLHPFYFKDYDDIEDESIYYADQSLCCIVGELI